MYKNKKLTFIILGTPFITFVGVFLFYPAIVNIYNSFFKYANRLDSNPIFVAWENYVWLFKQEDLITALKNTGILMIFTIVFQIGLALILALLVNTLKKGVAFFRIVFFMPIVVSATAIGLLYLLMIQPDGLFSTVIGQEGVNWLPAGKLTALVVIMAPIIWQYIGFYFVIFLTGLSGISSDIYEAAKIDGASSLRTTFKITLPMLQNVLRTCLVLAITGTLKVFDFPHIIAANGAPGKENLFLGTYNYYLYGLNRVGESAVFSLLIVVIGVVVAWTSNKLLKENKDI